MISPSDLTEIACDTCRGRVLATVRLLPGRRASVLCPRCRSVTTAERSTTGAVLVATAPGRKSTIEAARR